MKIKSLKTKIVVIGAPITKTSDLHPNSLKIEY